MKLIELHLTEFAAREVLAAVGVRAEGLERHLTTAGACSEPAFEHMENQLEHCAQVANELRRKLAEP